MPLQLPNLDDRRFDDLVEEARSLIPAWAPEWTNHNPSDPGITLIELFAYLAESLLYRLNRVTDDQRRKFLKLLNGPGWPESGDLRQDVRQTVLALRARYRAVTARDYELLATEDFNAWHERQRGIEQALDPLEEWWQVTGLNSANPANKPSRISEAELRAHYRARSASDYKLPVTEDFSAWHKRQRQIENGGDPLQEWWEVTGLDRADTANRPSRIAKVVRAHCVPQRNLGAGTEGGRREPLAGHVSVIAVPAADPANAQAQLQALWGFLNERRTLATRHHVVAPFFVPVQPELIIVGKTGVPADALSSRIIVELSQFMHPIVRAGGRPGWPFGRDVYVSELMAALEGVDGVDYVVDLMLFSTRAESDPASRVAGEPIWHADGDLIGIALEPHHLPEARWSRNPADQIVIVSANRVLPVRFDIQIAAAADAEVARLKRDIKLAVRARLHPLRGGPGPASGSQSIILTSIRSAIAAVPGISAVPFLTVETDPSRLEFAGGQQQGVRVDAGEVVDLRFNIDIVLSPS